MPIFFISLLLIALFGYLYTKTERFGSLPSGKRLERIKKSLNYINGAFRNKEDTPAFTGGANVFKIMWEVQLKRNKNTSPNNILPAVKSDLHQLNLNDDILIWFGHSSYYFQLDGLRFLVDPVLNGSASPFSFITKAYKGTNIYSDADIPNIDYLILTHDHWDHLNFETIKKLMPKIKNIICPLGVGAHLERWGFEGKLITEMDWDETHRLAENKTLTSVPARHFSGRSLKRNQSLWSSYVLNNNGFKIFLGADGGFGKHFEEIAQKFAPFDFAFLENGQYHKYWQYVHCTPAETAQVIKLLQARQTIAMHSCKFTLSTHSWDEPLAKLSALSKKQGFNLLTPKIGEPIYLKKPNPGLTNWWEGV